MSELLAKPLVVKPLPPGHRCRTDDLAYTSISEWFADHAGHVPIQAAAALDRFVRQHHCSFAVAFVALTNHGPIILIEPTSDGPAQEPAPKP